MAFSQSEAEDLLVRTGRRCCICRMIHKVSIHHIIPLGEGGTNDIDNGIPLCPNCHDEVHKEYGLGSTSRKYTPSELKSHRDYMKELVADGTLTKDHVTNQQIDDSIRAYQESQNANFPDIEVVHNHASGGGRSTQGFFIEVTSYDHRDVLIKNPFIFYGKDRFDVWRGKGLVSAGRTNRSHEIHMPDMVLAPKEQQIANPTLMYDFEFILNIQAGPKRYIHRQRIFRDGNGKLDQILEQREN